MPITPIHDVKIISGFFLFSGGDVSERKYSAVFFRNVSISSLSSTP